MADNLGQPQEAEKNPFDAEDMIQAQEPGLAERARLNTVDSFYRGTITGAAGMFARKKLADDPSADPTAREKAKKDYNAILNDLGRYEVMRDFAGPIEMSAAFSGQMFGGSLSPEAWITRIPGAGRLFGPLIEKPIGRFGEQSVTQAAVQGATDPAVQALSIGAGTQKEYNPARTVAAVGIGAGIGAALHIPHELAVPSVKSAEPPIASDPAEITKSLAKENAQAKAGDVISSAEDKSLEGVVNEKTAEAAETATSAQAEENLPQESGLAGVAEQPALPSIGELGRGERISARGALSDIEGSLRGGSVDVMRLSEPPTAQELDDLIEAGRTHFDKEIDRIFGEDAARVKKIAHGRNAWKIEDIIDEKFPRDSSQAQEARAVVFGSEGHPIVNTESLKALRDKLSNVEFAVDDAAKGDIAPLGKELAWIAPKLPDINAPESTHSESERIAVLSLARAVQDMQAKSIDAEKVLKEAVAYTGQRINGDKVDAALLLGRLSDYAKRYMAFGEPSAAAPKQFALTVKEPQDIRGFVRAAGGLKDWKGELKAADINKRFPGLVSNKGIDLDKMREAATEAGYLAEDSTPDDLVQALLSDEPVYSMRDRDQAMEYKAQKQAHEHATAIKEARQELSALEANPLYHEIHDEAARLMVHEGMSADDALAHAAETIGPTLEPGRAPAYRAIETEGLQFKKRTATGESIPKTPVGTTAAAAAEPPNNGQLLSLQEQGARLAEEIGHPLRQGRVQGGKEAEGQFDVKQGVVRVKNIADFETIAHEAGHYIDAKLGDQLKKLQDQFSLELGLMDYDPARNDVSEGFAEFVRQYITAPQAAARSAPRFFNAFEEYLGEQAPSILEALQAARQAYAAWEAAPSGARIDAMVKAEKPEGILAAIKRDGLAATVSNFLTHSYQALLDDKAPVTRAVRDMARMIRDAKGEIPSFEGSANPELLARLFSRSHQAAERDFLDGVRPYHRIVPEGPGLNAVLMKATGGTKFTTSWDPVKAKQFSNYVAAKRIAYLWKKKDAGLLENRPAAMTKGDAELAIAELEKENPQFAEAAQMLHDYTRQLLRKMFEGGLIERELYDKLQAEEFYAPLYRDMSDKPLSSAPGSAGGARSEGPGVTQLVKRMRGSDRDILDPVRSIMTQTFLVERTLAHNDMIKALVDMARAAQEAGAVGIGRILEEVPPKQLVGSRFNLADNVRAAAREHGIDENDTKVLLGGLTDLFGDDPIMGTMFHQEPTGKRGEPIVFYKDGGQLRAVRVISKDEGIGLYEALTALPPAMRDLAVTLGSASATMLRAGVTSSPDYALANFLRDQLGTAIIRSDFLPFWHGLRGVVSDVKQNEMAQLYVAAGGMAPGSGASGLSELINGDIDMLARKGWAVKRLGGLKDLFTKADVIAGAKTVSDLVGISEAGTRLGLFETVYKDRLAQGVSEYDAMLEAAFQSTDLLDFSRHGSGTELVRKLVPFLNSSLQGLDKMRRTMLSPLYRAAIGDVVTKQEQAEVRNAAIALFKFAGIGGALGYAYSLWGSQHQAYLDANDRLRATHIVIPGDPFGWPGKVLVIPKPFELALGFNLGEALGQATVSDPRAADFALTSAYELLMPPNILENVPGLKTYAELKLNKSFFTGRDIVPEDLQKVRPEEQFNARTSPLAKVIGQKIGVSPIKVDYAIGQSFGNWGRNILNASRSFDPDAPISAMEDSMFARRFIKSAFVGSESDKRYWGLSGETNGEYATAKANYEKMVKEFRDKDAMRFLAGLPEGQRVFVQLNSDAGENGKLLHDSDERRLHPLIRAGVAISLINGYSRTLMDNTQSAYATGDRTPMSPDKRRTVLDALSALKAMEQQNALILLKEPGFEGRKLQDTDRQFAVLKFIAPDVANEIATRYATAKIAPMATIERLWPQMARRLLADGHNADLRDMAADARSDGYAFGGEKIKKPTKRRIEMQAVQ